MTNTTDEVLENFYDFNYNLAKLPMITVYYNSLDYPGIYVARLFELKPEIKPTKYIIKGESEQEIRDKIPRIFAYLNRSEDDEKQIVGTYF